MIITRSTTPLHPDDRLALWYMQRHAYLNSPGLGLEVRPAEGQPGGFHASAGLLKINLATHRPSRLGARVTSVSPTDGRKRGTECRKTAGRSTNRTDEPLLHGPGTRPDRAETMREVREPSRRATARIDHCGTDLRGGGVEQAGHAAAPCEHGDPCREGNARAGRSRGIYNLSRGSVRPASPVSMERSGVEVADTLMSPEISRSDARGRIVKQTASGIVRLFSKRETKRPCAGSSARPTFLQFIAAAIFRRR